jgi:hypothetical protein
MGYRLVLTGNVAAIGITVGAFLQLYSWPVAGLLILASLATPVLLSHRWQMGQVDQVDPVRNPRESTYKQSAKPPVTTVQAPKQTVEQREQLKHEKLKPGPVKPTSPPLAAEAKPREPPTIIEPDDFVTFDLELDSGNRVEGKVSASGVVNAYILTEDNLTNLDLGQEFWYEAGSEGVEEATLQFTAPEEGKWVLVVENAGAKDVSVTVKIRVTQESPGRKPIHGSLTESVSGLTPADGKLESL